MGAASSCFYGGSGAPRRPQPPPNLSAAAIEALGRSSRSKRKDNTPDGVLTNEQALAAAALLLQHGNAEGAPFDRSASLRYGNSGKKKDGDVGRSKSSRPRAAGDPVVAPLQLVKQDLKIENLETNHFVLVHGGGFGAWCWYKTIALLEDNGFKVTAVDLTGSGINSFDTNKITGLPEYAKPLTSLLERLEDGEKVVLVGHDIGGTCASYAMEMFPKKVAKAIFVCAAMLMSGQNTLEMFSNEAIGNDLMKESQLFVFANGKDNPPTAIDLNKSLVKDLLFNQSPAKDVSLALVSLRPIPFAPIMEKLSLSDENYGSVRRFYIETTEDNALPLSLQQNMCGVNPPERIFKLKGSDHSPFFSKPQALHKIFVEISKLLPLQTQSSSWALY